MTCPQCAGTGKVSKKFFITYSITCPQCNGRRWVADPNPIRPKVTPTRHRPFAAPLRHEPRKRDDDSGSSDSGCGD